MNAFSSLPGGRRPLSADFRICCPQRPFVGSLEVTTSSPAPRSSSASIATCVVLPAPSIPSTARRMPDSDSFEVAISLGRSLDALRGQGYPRGVAPSTLNRHLPISLPSIASRRVSLLANQLPACGHGPRRFWSCNVLVRSLRRGLSSDFAEENRAVAAALLAPAASRATNSLGDNARVLLVLL